MNESDEFQIIYPTVFNYTVPIKIDAGTDDDEIGTGVLFDIGGRLLVATAKHCIEKEPAVLEGEFSLPCKSRIKIPNKRRHRGFDIGFLELGKDSDIPVLNKGHCSLEMICLEPIPDKAMLHIVGFPAAARDFDDNRLTAVRKGFGTRFLRSQEEHFLCEYPENGWKWNATTKGWSQAALDSTPSGYSGAGCWAFLKPRSGDLFDPAKHIRLHAIQCAWSPKERWVKCVPIIHWLNLICACHPDLRDCITEMFPSVDE